MSRAGGTLPGGGVGWRRGTRRAGTLGCAAEADADLGQGGLRGRRATSTRPASAGSPRCTGWSRRLGLVERDRPAAAAVEGAPALSRVRSRAEPGLQRAVRRHPARGHRTAAPRHRLHERPGCGPDPGPDHGRGLLPPVRRGRRGDVDGGDQRGAPEAVGRARARACSARSPTSTPTAPSRPPAGSTRPGWTSPTRASGATRR